MKLRDGLFWAHLIVGVTAGLMVLSMAVTGILMAYEPQIVPYSERKVRKVEPVVGVKRITLKQAVVEANKVKNSKPVGVAVSADPTASITVRFGKEGTVFIDPYAGTFLGTGSKVHKAMHAIEDWHRWLGNRDIGRPITGITVIAFFALAVSGLILWWPASFKWPAVQNSISFNPKAKGKTFYWNLHNVFGFWVMPLLITTITTGLIMAHPWANDALFRLAGSEPPPRAEKSAPAAKETAKAEPGKGKKEEKPVDLDAVYAIAVKQMPNWNSMSIRLPQAGNGLITVSMQEANPVPVGARSQLSLDAGTLEIKKWEPFAENSLGTKWRAWVKVIHTGEAFGILGQTLALVSALSAIMLVWTGFAMAFQRFFGTQAVTQRALKRTARRK